MEQILKIEESDVQKLLKRYNQKDDLNEKLNKHKWSILKLVEDTLIDGEVLIAHKRKDEGHYLYVISEERLKGIHADNGHKFLELLNNNKIV